MPKIKCLKRIKLINVNLVNYGYWRLDKWCNRQYLEYSVRYWFICPKEKQLNKYLDFQREENQKTRDYNLNLAKQQNQWNIDQWNRENEYNTPLNQMNRYKSAGLNPDLMYGQQNLSAASPEMTSGEGATPMDYSPVANGPTIGEAASIAANARLTNAQAKLAESQADKVDSETVGQTINNEWLPKLLKGQTEINEADVKQKLADAGLKVNRLKWLLNRLK